MELKEVKKVNMGSNKKYTTEQYINLVKEKHNNKYSYPNTFYIGYSKNIEVYCQTHGVFEIQASGHLSGRGCQRCRYERFTKEEILTKAKEIHGEKYDYSKVTFKSLFDKVIISCDIHGEFKQAIGSHSNGNGCSKCGRLRGIGIKKKAFQKSVLEKFENVHGNRYDYSKFICSGTQDKGIIICEKHGEFKQNYKNHVAGSGCRKCSFASHRKRSEYIEKVNGRTCTFYTIRCFNNNEEFYKIGITVNDVKTRYYGNLSMPYEYEIISEIKGSAGFIWDLEVGEKRKLKEFRYAPKIPFGGSKTECFKKYEL